MGLLGAQNAGRLGINPDEAFEDFRMKREALLTSQFFNPEKLASLTEAERAALRTMVDQTITSAQIWKRIATPLIYDQLSMADPEFHTYNGIEEKWDETVSFFDKRDMSEEERIERLTDQYLTYLPRTSKRLDEAFSRPTHPEGLIEFQRKGVDYLQDLKNIRALLE